MGSHYSSHENFYFTIKKVWNYLCNTSSTFNIYLFGWREWEYGASERKKQRELPLFVELRLLGDELINQSSMGIILLLITYSLLNAEIHLMAPLCDKLFLPGNERKFWHIEHWTTFWCAMWRLLIERRHRMISVHAVRRLWSEFLDRFLFHPTVSLSFVHSRQRVKQDEHINERKFEGRGTHKAKQDHSPDVWTRVLMNFMSWKTAL